MKKLLIISPHFPPRNAADMHRVRLSLPHYEENGWQPTVVCVDPLYYDVVEDPLLLESIPSNVKVHYVKALQKKWTSKFGLGSLALRSFLFYEKYVTRLLRKEHFDLIFFSTTEFPVCVLGAYWTKKFNIPYVIDMQDPWHSEYYQNKPKAQRPPKYWFSYRLNKYLEPIAMRKVSGIMSVSADYIEVLTQRYNKVKKIPTAVITFPAAIKDFEIVDANKAYLATPLLNNNTINLVYIGRGGHDLKQAATLLFENFRLQLSKGDGLFEKFKFYFIGTSYAPKGMGIATIKPIADSMGLANHVYEQTDRISYFETLAYLSNADGLVILGSDDPGYTASKIYPYILSKKPILAIFNLKSSAAEIIRDCNAGSVADIQNKVQAGKIIQDFLNNMANPNFVYEQMNIENFSIYSAEALTKKQCDLFNQVVQC
ncbi:glycosyltransferase [Pedobacter sp. UBA5917]|uniref:glycosyltransferase n=1 Tax=Pedobacter sp. UBA5917 TaxID=1947061 RepID=UPI0025ECBBD2|nr:glycosyltransferase [Pedobacter sp. UBA5917]